MSGVISSMTTGTMPTDEPHIVYRCYDEDDNLLYVGMTINWLKRERTHTSSAPWWDQVAYVRKTLWPSRIKAKQKETEAILKEHPLYNLLENLYMNLEINPAYQRLSPYRKWELRERRRACMGREC